MKPFRLSPRRASCDVQSGGRVRRIRGLALVLVLWLLVALATLAAALAGLGRTDVRIAGLTRVTAQAEALGQAGALLALARLEAEPLPEPGIMESEHEFLGHTLRARISPAEAYLNLNAAPQALLAGLLHHIGELDQEEADTLAARIVDWRDPDETALDGQGDERQPYEAAGSPFRPRNRPLVGVEDLLQVLGMRQAAYDKIRPFVHVHGTSPGIDPFTAPPELLKVLAGADSRLVDGLLAAREADARLADTSSLEQAYLVRASGSLYRVDVRVVLDGRSWQRSLWVLRGGGRPGEAWKILAARPAEVISETEN